MSESRKYCELLDRDRYVEYRLWLWGEQPPFTRDRVIAFAEQAFDRVAGVQAPRLEKGCNQGDIDQLDAVGKRIADFAAKRLAHLGADTPDAEVPTYGDLDEALETFEGVLLKYHSILRGVHRRVTPVQNTDWEAAFAVPWFRNDGYVEHVHEQYPRR